MDNKELKKVEQGKAEQPQQEPNGVVIPLKVNKALLNYLMQNKMSEVEHLVNALRAGRLVNFVENK